MNQGLISRCAALSAIAYLVGCASASNVQVPAGTRLSGIPAGSHASGSLPSDSWEVDQDSAVISSSNKADGWLIEVAADGKISITAPAKGPLFGLTAKVDYTDAAGGQVLTVDFDELPGANYLATSPCLPTWAEVNAANIDGPSADEHTNAATGVHIHEPAEDIDVYNPTGPTAIYKREYRTSLAAAQICAPGLSYGWVDDYSYSFALQMDGDTQKLVLTHPDGFKEAFTPQLDDAKANAQNVMFSGPPGTPYTVGAVPSSTPGQWASITIYFKTLASWTFFPEQDNPNLYLVGQMSSGSTFGTASAGVNNFIVMNRDPANGFRMVSIANDKGDVLLSFTYDGGYLQSVKDIPGGRQIDYGFDMEAGTNCLASVSQIHAFNEASPGLRWGYTYSNVPGMPATAPFLTTLTRPNPGGSGTVEDTVEYIPGNGQVRSHTDANGNVTRLTYGAGGTKVEVAGPPGG